jgi:hypothetical protein
MAERVPDNEAEEQAGLRIVPAVLRDGRIESPAVEADGGAVAAGRSILVFRGAFSEAEMLGLRRAVRQWGDATEAFPNDRSASLPGLNFHRIDPEGHPSWLKHVFHQYGFSDPESLPAPLAGALRSVAGAMVDLQNRLAGTDLRLAPDALRVKVIRHPRGGGMIAPHRHPFLPQKVATFLNLSEPGRDYRNGDARFRLGGRWVSTTETFRCGDVLAWRYDLVHDIPPVDPDAPLDWTADDGLWILAPENVESHAHSNAVETSEAAPAA